MIVNQTEQNTSLDYTKVTSSSPYLPMEARRDKTRTLLLFAETLAMLDHGHVLTSF